MGGICALVFSQDISAIVDVVESIGKNVDSSVDFTLYV